MTPDTQVLVAADTVATGHEVLRPGWVSVDDGRITGCGAGTTPRTPDIVAETVTPGFVDIHVHGGGGADYSDLADPDEPATKRAAAFHLSHGTTTGLASLVSLAPDALLARVRALAAATRAGTIAGIHLEGPWLSATRCGAHNPAVLRDPDPHEIDAVLAAAGDAIRMVTLAPERPGALAAIRRFAAAGVTVAVGHTAADYPTTRAAIDAGATVGTHLFNGMPGLHHRDPGPIPALLEDERVTVELIVDRVHVHPAAVRHAVRAAGAHRVALVTDAVAAAGGPDGPYRLGGLDLEVADGVARVAGTRTIAGSTVTAEQMLSNTIAALGGPLDDALAAAVRMLTETPARAVGLRDAGVLREGAPADLVILDESLRVRKVLRGGIWANLTG